MSSPLSEETSISEGELRAIVKLLGDVAVVEGGLEVKRRCLMQGLNDLIESDGWLWTIGQVDADSDAPMNFEHLYNGISSKQTAAMLDSPSDTADPSPDDKHLAALVGEGKHFTRTRQQLVDDDQWYSSNNVKTYRLNHGLDNCMYSITPLDSGGFTGVGFFRKVGREPFSERQRRIAHVVTTEVRWLVESDLPAEYGGLLAALTPRLRTVFTLLVDGYGCDEVAELLNLSPHTVKGYMKEVYKHFEVRSQIKLIRLFKTGR